MCCLMFKNLYYMKIQGYINKNFNKNRMNSLEKAGTDGTTESFTSSQNTERERDRFSSEVRKEQSKSYKE